MTQITAQLVKQLREKTGAGMMDCKKALTENAADFEAAVDWLRTKGLSKAAKKSDRVAADGLVGVATKGNQGAVVEINAETDFVARNETFQEFVTNVAKIVLEVGEDIEALKAANYPASGRTVGDELTDLIATIGENMSIRRASRVGAENGVVASYVHSAVAPGLGKIGVLVALDSDGDGEKVAGLGKNIAMHVAASKPLALSEDGVDQDVISREREVYAQQARETGKPENIIEKMVDGRVRKFLEESVLLKQKFVMDPDKSVETVVKESSKETGGTTSLVAFARFTLGDGIKKEEQDFAAEVEAAVNG